MVMGEWKEYKLKDLTAKIGSGATPTGGDNSYKAVGVSLIRSQNILDFKFSYNGLAFIDDEQADALRNVTVESGDVLLNITGDSVARVCKVPWKVLPARVTQHVAIIRAEREKLDSDYLLYFMQAKKEYLLSISEIGATRRALTKGMLEDLDLTIPDLPEQKSIASILSSLDDKIDLLHRQNKTLEALAETLFRQWFVEEAEEGWETGTIEDEFDFTMGQSPPGSSYNEDGKGIVFFQGRTDFGFRFPEPRVYTTEPNRLAKKFDTLISVRAPVGDINMAMEECCLGRGVAAFRYKYNPTFHTYTYYKLRSLMAQIKQFEDSGTVFGAIGKDDFKKLENIVPPSHLIEKFQKQANSLDEKIFNNTNQIHTLTRLRDTLLPKLMSGEVKVVF